MFTGLIQDLATVHSLEHHQVDGAILTLKTNLNITDVQIGDSICCSGVCLSVIKKSNSLLSFMVSQETFSKSYIKDWGEGCPVNIEKSLTLATPLGGHVVSGHVDLSLPIHKISMLEKTKN